MVQYLCISNYVKIETMAYTTNPKLPRLRMQAVHMVRRGASTHEVAKYFGYNQSTIARWVRRANKEFIMGSENLNTRSSRPKTHPRSLSPEIVAAIVEERLKHRRCAEVIHHTLLERGIVVSLSSVKRTLGRQELLRPRSKWKRMRPAVERPKALAPGDLVQIDTIHFIDWQSQQRFYIYTLIDLYSRTAYAEVHDKLRQTISHDATLRAQRTMGFRYTTVQSDNGPEFQRYFHDMLKAKGIALRHSRVRQSNDNAHVERFNRTIQDECLGSYPSRKSVTQVKLNNFLHYYNTERMHMGIKYKRPRDLLTQTPGVMQSY
jgi:transposase InsO family protein